MDKPTGQPDRLLLQLECLADDTRLRLLRLLERHGALASADVDATMSRLPLAVTGGGQDVGAIRPAF